MNERITES